MARCECCDRRFRRADAVEEFESDFWGLGLKYDKIKPVLCGECSVEKVQDLEDDVYFDTCEECGQEFDYCADSSAFDNAQEIPSISLTDVWESGMAGKILCCECALEFDKAFSPY